MSDINDATRPIQTRVERRTTQAIDQLADLGLDRTCLQTINPPTLRIVAQWAKPPLGKKEYILSGSAALLVVACVIMRSWRFLQDAFLDLLQLPIVWRAVTIIFLVIYAFIGLAIALFVVFYLFTGLFYFFQGFLVRQAYPAARWVDSCRILLEMSTKTDRANSPFWKSEIAKTLALWQKQGKALGLSVEHKSEAVLNHIKRVPIAPEDQYFIANQIKMSLMDYLSGNIKVEQILQKTSRISLPIINRPWVNNLIIPLSVAIIGSVVGAVVAWCLGFISH